MNVSSLEITQATIELSIALAFIVSAFLLMSHSLKVRGIKLFIAMFFTISLMLISESVAYICRGNIDTVNIFFTRLSNFLVFFLNFFILSIFIRYLYCILGEYGVYPSKNYIKIVDIFFLLAVIILIVNLFTGWMYGFDDNDYYKRNYMWYVFSLFSFSFPICSTIIFISNKSKISKKIFWIFLIFIWSPYLLLFLQAFIYGYSILSIGIAIDSFFMFIFHLIKLKQTKFNDEEIDSFKSKRFQSIAVFFLMAVFITASITSCVFSINRVSKDNEKNNSKIIASMVCDRIENEFFKSITVSETMCQAYTMKEVLYKSGEYGATSVESDMRKYLSSIKEGFGYQMVYAVSNKSMVYYNYNGIGRYIDKNNYGEDIWYKDFIESDKEYEINIDKDKDNGYLISYFVNSKVRDENGNLLGVCGVGVEMQHIKDLFLEYEEKYNVSIALTDENGLIKASSSIDKIEKEYIDSNYFANVDSNNYHLIESNNIFKLTRYLSDIDMYFVIDVLNVSSNIVIQIVLPSIIIFSVGLVLLAVFFVITYIDEKRAHETIIEKKKAALTDEMTGLFNRNAYTQDIVKYNNIDNYNNIHIIEFDLNGLKMINDTKGHTAGDEFIIGSAHCIMNVFQKYGKCYRTGGDEFIAIVKCSKEKFEECMITFKHLINNFKGNYINELSISFGIVHCYEHKDLSFVQMIKLADKLMYEEKDKYYKSNQ